MIDFIDNHKEAEEFVVDRLKQVKELLNEIAEETGLMYVAVPVQEVALFGRIGSQAANWLVEAHTVIAERQVLANMHLDFMFKKHPERYNGGDEQEPPKDKKLTPEDLAEAVPDSQKHIMED